MTSDELALLAAIHDRPRDDLPRLVYADWLDDHGEPEHAEFIRLQCRPPYVAISTGDPARPGMSFNLGFPTDDPTATARLERLWALLPVFYGRERYALHRAAAVPDRGHEQHYRGLPLVPATLRGDSSDGGAELLGALGPFARLDLSLHTGRLADWLAHPVLARVDVLRVWPQPDGAAARRSFEPEDIRRIAASPVPDRLEELHLYGWISTDAVRLSQRLLEPRVPVNYRAR